MRILVLDIETAPSMAYVWGLWNENIPLERVIEQGYILSWAGKFVGEREVHAYCRLDDYGDMLAELWALLDEADVVVTYNGDKFDVPHINRSFLEIGLSPPSPYKTVDLLKTVRNRFKFQSNKLAFVAKALGIGAKDNPGGFKTWIGCMNDDEASYAALVKYNKKDVVLTEKLYKKVLPWIKSHPNHGLYDGKTKCSCPNCGSTNLQKRGLSHTKSFIYQRYVCNKCGSWSRAPRPLKDSRKDLAVVLTKEN